MIPDRETFRCGGLVWRREESGLYVATACGYRLEIHGEYGIMEPWPFTACKVTDAGGVEAREWITRPSPPAQKTPAIILSRFSSRIQAATRLQNQVKFRKRPPKGKADE